MRRRFAEIVILDHDALTLRIAYAVNNPVEANLVRSHRDWLGLCFFVGATSQRHAFTVFNDARYQRARDAEGSGADVDRSSFYETRELEIAGLDAELAEKIAAAVDDREANLRKMQTAVVGMEHVLKSSPSDRPKLSARAAMPLCFATTRQVRADFVRGWYAFVDAFRKASADFGWAGGRGLSVGRSWSLGQVPCLGRDRGAGGRLR